MSHESVRQNTQTACQPNISTHDAIVLLANAINDLSRDVHQENEKLQREIDGLKKARSR